MEVNNKSFPPDFVRQISSQFPSNVSSALLESYANTDSPISVRLNNRKRSYHSEKIELNPIVAEKVEWASKAFYLRHRPLFISDPFWHAGYYYVQEASSMVIEQAIHTIYADSIPNELVALDACAAPGGKSTHLLNILPDNSIIVSHEFDRKRAQILNENIHRWGLTNTIRSSGDLHPYSQLPSLFDLILCDAPCSGEGMFRKDPFAQEQWNPSLVEQCESTQKDLLGLLWPSLKKDGYLIYSTCTFNEKENAQQIKRLIDAGVAEIAPLAIDSFGFYTDRFNFGFHALPHIVKGEGFYICALKKLAELPSQNSNGLPPRFKNKRTNRANSKNQLSRNQNTPKDVPEWIKHSGSTRLQIEENTLKLFNASDRFNQVYKKLRTVFPRVSAGLELGIFDHSHAIFKPKTTLAWATQIELDNLPHIELSQQDLIRNARGEALHINVPKGFIVLSFQNKPISIGKSTGNRINSLQEKHQRIKKNIEEVDFFTIFTMH